jgi:DNA-binding CsgD family transcriptional regulator
MPMSSDRYRRLTEAHRDTLRLYHQYLQIKEIAQRLGISESTVNQRLTQCRKIVGATSSRAAAIWVAQHEAQKGICSPSTYSFSAMASPSLLSSVEAVTVMGTDDGSEDSDMARDDGPALPGSAVPPDNFPWPFSTAASPRNRLGSWTRLALVWAVAASLLIAAMILVLLGIGFQEALVSLQHLFIAPR